MKQEETQRRRRGRGRADKVLERAAQKPGILTDEQSIELRRQRAEEEKAPVTPLERHGGFLGLYEVGSAQWHEPYRVEIRSLSRAENTCTCQDWQNNRLGTCKHVERTLQFLASGRKREFVRAAADGSPLYEVFLDVRAEPPTVRLLAPQPARPEAAAALSPLFGADGRLLGDPLDAVPALERAVAGLEAADRKRVRISLAIAPWVDQLRRRQERAAARAAFLEDVRLGKRTLNPVLHPLHPYQQDGMLHLAFGERAMLADEMGLGKTVQAIAACELLQQLRGIGRVLIVCPASLKAEWEEQIRQFTGKAARLVYGPRAARLRLYRETGFYTVANYEQARVDVDELNARLAPDVVILDEAQRIKNWPTKTAKTIKRLRSPCAFVLTGTPLENRIEEVYSLVEFVDPNLFGALFRFQRDFFRLDEEGGVSPDNLPELHRRLGAVMLRRRKDEVETELPERTTKTFFVEMEPEQRERYDEYDAQAARLAALARKRPLTKREFERLQMLLACMRMVCDTPYILDRDCRVCPKLKELEPILDEALSEPATKAIVFSEWVQMLQLVRELADEKGIGYARHTGEVDQRRRRDEILRFKTDAGCRLFLSSEAGGTGLNLQVANVVINLDLPWNPARLEQRIARAWRKHQTRSVRVVNLVTQDSIEQAMLDKLAYKQQLATGVLDGRFPEGGIRAARGRQAFLEQVEALLGRGAGAAAVAAAAAAAERREVPAPQRLKEDLAARFPSQLLGIEAAGDDRAFVVVARDDADRAAMRRVAAEAAPDARVEVLDLATYELLRRLHESGVIAFTGRTRALFRAQGLEPVEAPPAAPPRVHAREALDHLAGVARKRKMAALLAGGELFDEALPPARDAFRAALEALFVYHDGAPPETPLSAEGIAAAVVRGAPLGEWRALWQRLESARAADAAAGEILRAAETATADMEAWLRERAAS